MRPDGLWVITLFAAPHSARSAPPPPPPAARRGGVQHFARRRPALADILVRLADAPAAAGRKIPPDALAREIFAGGREFSRDLGPVAFQLLGNELREAGQRPLTHLRA